MRDKADDNLLAAVATYYSDKLEQHGQNARGVDWNGEESQALRFHQLCRIINPAQSFSLNDLGCGYGALFDFLCQQYDDFEYTGIDVSGSMIDAARQRYTDATGVRFRQASEPEQAADYCVASGIFNVRLQQSNDEWKSYLESMLDAMNRTSGIGFAFNCLTAYSDEEHMKDYLYYADPCALFDLCKRRYSPNVALLHDYGLYEFTILVRKQL